MHRASIGWLIKVAVAALLIVAAQYTDIARAASTESVAVAAGPAELSINTLAQQMHFQILYPLEYVEGITTQALNGRFAPLDALQQLLTGTGLTVEVVTQDPLMVVLHKEKEPSTGSIPRDIALTEPKAKISTELGPPPAEPPTVVIESGLRADITNLSEVDEITFTREDIEQSGFATAHDLIATVPQNFGGGPNENTVRGSGAETNSGLGSGVNLRGLSDAGTVILVNGRRLAPSGTSGGFTDIANIPFAAIDHMVIYPEGETARYGIDAIGGIVNFELKKDTGFETSAQVGGLEKSASYLERFDQSAGFKWSGGNLYALFEYYERDALPAGLRRLATSDLTAYGGQNFDSPYGNPGTLETYGATGATLWAIPHGQNGVGLQSDQFTPNTVNLRDTLKGTTILPRQQLSSLVVTGDLAITTQSKLFLDAILSRRVAESAQGGESLPVTVNNGSEYYFDPTNTHGPVTVLYNFGPDLGPVLTHARIDTGQITGGISKDRDKDGENGIVDHAEFHITYAFEHEDQIQKNLVDPNKVETYANNKYPDPALNVFGDGSYTDKDILNDIRSQGTLTLRSQLASAELSMDRRLLRLPGGDLTLTLSDEYRRQTLTSSIFSPTSLGIAPADLGRTTLATYAQMDFPIVGPSNQISAIDSLKVSAAIRYEHYSDVGAVTAPQFALVYHPDSRVLLRGTWARLAHAPELPDLSELNNASFLYPLQIPPAPQPPSPPRYTTALIVDGSNSALKPEHATTWTAGVSVTPFEPSELQLGMTYFHTDYVNRITSPTSLPLNVLLDQSQSWLLDPVTPAVQTDICTHSQFVGTRANCLHAPIGAIVDLRLRNIGTLKTEGIDWAARYELTHPSGTWTFGLNATYLLQYVQQQTPSSAEQDLLSTDHNPIDLRLRASLAWRNRNLWTRAILNFQNSYEDVDSIPRRRVGSWTTLDGMVGYDLLSDDPDSKRATHFTLSAHNLLNRQPPLLNNQYGIGYDQENASLLGRVISFTVRQHW